jgi:CheY-like chemotaxis protein
VLVLPCACSALCAQIIAITGAATVEVRNSCLAAGMNDFMTKPIEFSALLLLIARCEPFKTLITG